MNASIIDWCEENYAVTVYLAEFWNTITNVAFVACAIKSGVQARRAKAPLRVLLNYVWLICVGLGSIAFHATLRFDMQLLDELPMLLFALQSVYCLLCLEPRISFRQRASVMILATIAVLFGVWLYIHSMVPVVFQLVFSCIVATCLVGSFRATALSTRSGHKGAMAAKMAMQRAFWILLTAFGVWNIDLHFCDSLKWARLQVGTPMAVFFELHAWWHILTALGSAWFISGLLMLSAESKDVLLTSNYFLPSISNSENAKEE